MNRFETGSKLSKIKLSAFAGFITTGAFIVLFVVFLHGISSVSDTTLQKQEESLRTAIDRSIIQCYAVEGTYPPSLSYLEDHYGLIYDHSLFFVDYQAYGSNIFPDVTVLRK